MLVVPLIDELLVPEGVRVGMVRRGRDSRYLFAGRDKTSRLDIGRWIWWCRSSVRSSVFVVLPTWWLELVASKVGQYPVPLSACPRRAIICKATRPSLHALSLPAGYSHLYFGQRTGKVIDS